MKKLAATFLALSATMTVSCTQPDKQPIPLDTWEILEVKTGDFIMARKIDFIYEIQLACIKAVPGEESRQFLQRNGNAGGKVIVQPIGQVQMQKDANDRIVAEVFINLGDGPQSLNEAQLLGGMAKLDEAATPQNCPRLEALKSAQAEAKTQRIGIWIDTPRSLDTGILKTLRP